MGTRRVCGRSTSLKNRNAAGKGTPTQGEEQNWDGVVGQELLGRKRLKWHGSSWGGLGGEGGGLSSKTVSVKSGSYTFHGATSGA